MDAVISCEESLLIISQSAEKPLWKRLIFLVWVFLECLLLCGVSFGWASLVYVLKSEGIYAELCDSENIRNVSGLKISDLDPSPNVQCSARDANFDLTFTIASGTSAVVSMVVGNINYRYGTRISRFIATVMLVSGALLLAFESTELPWVMFPGLTFLGIGGLTLLVTSTQISNLFPAHSSAVIGLVNGAFDASAIVLLVVKTAYEKGITYQFSFFLLASLNISVLVSTFVIYPRWFIRRRKPRPITEDANDELSIEASQKQTGVKGSVLSLTFMSHLLWFSILYLHFTYFISSLNPWLNYVLHNDKQKVSFYTDIHMYSLLPAIVVAWLSGVIYDWTRRLFHDPHRPLRGKIRASVIPLTMTSLTAVVLSVLMLQPQEEVLYATFIVVMIFRAFLYAIATSFLLMVFPLEQFGLMYSASLVCAGAVAFLQYALFLWSQHSGFNTVNTFLGGAATFTLVHPAYQFISSRKPSVSREHYDKI